MSKEIEHISCTEHSCTRTWIVKVHCVNSVIFRCVGRFRKKTDLRD